MEFRTYGAENYLKKNKPEEPTADFIEAITKLTEPRADIDYENSSFARIEKGSDVLDFSFQELSSEAHDRLSDLFDSLGKSGNFINERSDISKWKELTRFEISRESYNQPILDLIKLLPTDCRILFFPEKEFINACAISTNNKTPLILYVGDLSGEMVAPTLLHEIGHIIDHNNLKLAKTDTFITSPGHVTEAEELRKERAATGFELKVLRTRFKDNSMFEKANTLKFSKSFALNTYHNSIEATLSMKRAAWHSIGRHQQADEDLMWQEIEAHDEYDKQLAEFEKIKQTNEYKEWRSKRPVNEEYDQMYTWEEWLEFIETKKTDKFKSWKMLPENSIIDDEEQERQKFEDDRMAKNWRDQGFEPPKAIKDVQ